MRSLAIVAVCAVFLSGCGASLTSVPTADLVGANAVAGPLALESAPAGAAGVSRMMVSKVDVVASAGDVTTPPVSGEKLTDAFVAVNTPGNTAYKIGPEDVVEISVFKVPELSRSVQVADGGTINLPLVGEIAAAGKTARDVELDLTKKLGDKYLRSPQVTVFVKEYNSQRVTVEGSVKKPGVYPIRGKTSLLQMIANAGGLEELADNGNVVVVRQVDGKRSAGRFDIDSIRKGTTADPALQKGDVVIANSSDAKAALQTFLKVLPIANVFAIL